MKIAMLHGVEDIRLADVPQLADPVGKQVLIRISFCGVCGTDLHKWLGHIKRERSGPLVLPRNLGHEYSGIVAAVGKEVTRFAAGQRVAVNPYNFCGKCAYCRNGIANFCRDRADYTDAWSEYALVPESSVYAIPDKMSLEVASLAEPLAACLYSVGLGEIRSGSVVIVLGGGPIGLMTLALSRYSGASKVILSEPVAQRRKLALELGADIVVDPLTENLREIVLDASEGMGADVAFDCVTTSRTLEQSMDSLRLGGTVVVVGNSTAEDRLALSPLDVHRKGIIIKGSHSRGYEFDNTIRWLSKLDLAPMISHKMELEDLSIAMNMLKNGEGVKILVTA